MPIEETKFKKIFAKSTAQDKTSEKSWFLRCASKIENSLD